MAKGHNRTGPRNADGSSKFGNSGMSEKGRGLGRGRNRDRLRGEGWRDNGRLEEDFAKTSQTVEVETPAAQSKGFRFNDGVHGNPDKKTTGITPLSAIQQLRAVGYDFVPAGAPSPTQRAAVTWAKRRFHFHHDVLVSNSGRSIIMQRGGPADEISIVYSGKNLRHDAARAIEDQVNGKRAARVDMDDTEEFGTGRDGFYRVGRDRFGPDGQGWSPL